MSRTTLRTLYETKPICFVCDGATVKDDLVLSRDPVGMYIGDPTHVYECGIVRNSVTIENCLYAHKYSQLKKFKHKMLWLWHITILRKNYVYLVGAMK